MSLLSRMSASAATHDVAALVDALMSNPVRPGPPDLLVPGAPSARVPEPPKPVAPARANAVTAAPRLPTGPTGLGTAAARALLPDRPVAPRTLVPAAVPTGVGGRRLPGSPSGPGAAAVRVLGHRAPPRRDADAADDNAVPALYCPPAVRDDRALGEEVDERLVAWAEEVGIYPGKLDMIRRAEFGRLIMLAHPETDDPERLLAAARCALAEWSVDDHYVDGEVEEFRPELLGQRLAIAHSVIDQAHISREYAPELERVVQADPVMRALRSALGKLADHATWTQVRRLRHELAIMFVAYNQEGVWGNTGRRPPVWEFLMHRHENSFVPCMVLIDAVAGYELPMEEFADPRVRRVFTMAGSATVIVNDLYSMGKEGPDDTSLPRLIAEEDGCTMREAVERTVRIHDEMMHAVESEAAALALSGSPQLGRFLAGLWAWCGGSREWHATSGRYHGDRTA
ncbi:family 2 encapsulin nanocompartment cargo protein terpene cyclase [Nocardiopsis sp. YSL2]|uniref:family 2 encapsulin nanocompartment cargo protein terpene cyclase n=1 Tax=Nocardiopsis sp. YSL2 TaxID=2939492 RepID=UPI0026F42405|nr:family 2 encapsulin nanocompartment cargo protein terpene cyclase [Nocardiopsis sp. YSL2]